MTKPAATEPITVTKAGYEKELARLQVELVRMQEWIVHEGLRLVVIFEGRLAVEARVAERARTYARSTDAAWRVPTAVVRFENDASEAATVIDVHTSDGVGVLYRITRALADFDVDIRSARVQTLGNQVVDAFYVVDSEGNKINDEETVAEIERAIVYALSTG